MCGRCTLTSTEHQLGERFGAEPPPGLAARYNVTPSQEVPIVRMEQDRKRVVQARWGLVSFWAIDRSFGRYSTINTRAETVDTKPAFRAALAA